MTQMVVRVNGEINTDVTGSNEVPVFLVVSPRK